MITVQGISVKKGKIILSVAHQPFHDLHAKGKVDSSIWNFFRPSKRPAGVLSLVLGPHSWGKELLSVAPVAAGMGSLLTIPGVMEPWLGVPQGTQGSDQYMVWPNFQQNVKSDTMGGVCIPLDTRLILYQYIGSLRHWVWLPAVETLKLSGKSRCKRIDLQWAPYLVQTLKDIGIQHPVCPVC